MQGHAEGEVHRAVSAVWLRLRSDFRHRWRAWIGLALIIGFAAGTAMALAQAARRSEHAYQRFADRQAAADVVMTGYSTFGLVGGVDLDAVARSGFVERSARAFVALPFSGRTDTGRALDATDGVPGRVRGQPPRDRRRALEDARRGAAPGPDAVGEATASFVLAERLGLHVGSTIGHPLLPRRHVRAHRDQAARRAGAACRAARPGREPAPDYADGRRVRLTVVGIEASPAEFPPLLTDLAPVLHLTPAFAHRYEREIVGSPLGYFKLRAGRDLRSFQLAVERLAAGKPVSFVSTRVNQGPKVQRSVHAEALALAVVAALVGLAGLVGVGQAMTRQTLAESDQLATLRTLGMRDAQLRTLVVVRLLGIALVGMRPRRRGRGVRIAVRVAPARPQGRAASGRARRPRRARVRRGARARSRAR